MADYKQGEYAASDHDADDKAGSSHASNVQKAIGEHKKSHVPHYSHGQQSTGQSMAKGGFNGPGGAVE